jgi:hypothetical protein
MLLLRRLIAVVDSKLGLSQPLLPLVDEFAARLFGELDYLQEGRNCERFSELYGSMPRVGAQETLENPRNGSMPRVGAQETLENPRIGSMPRVGAQKSLENPRKGRNCKRFSELYSSSLRSIGPEGPVWRDPSNAPSRAAQVWGQMPPTPDHRSDARNGTRTCFRTPPPKTRLHLVCCRRAPATFDLACLVAACQGCTHRVTVCSDRGAL